MKFYYIGAFIYKFQLLELETFIEAAQVPSLTIYTQKLNTAKQRMDNINSILQRIQERISRIEKNFIKKGGSSVFQY